MLCLARLIRWAIVGSGTRKVSGFSRVYGPCGSGGVSSEGSSFASLYLAPTTADFGSIPLTVASLDKVFILTNTGGTAVTISNITVTTDFVMTCDAVIRKSPAPCSASACT